MSQLNFFRETYESLSDDTKVSETPPEIPRFFSPVGTELIGVAHVFLSTFKHGMTMEVQPTIIDMDGHAAGVLRLCIKIEPKRLPTFDGTDEALCIEPIEPGDVLRLRVSVLAAQGIPYALSTFVNARFTFFQHTEEMIPENVDEPSRLQSNRSSDGSTGGTVGGGGVNGGPVGATVRWVDVFVRPPTTDHLCSLVDRQC